MTDLLDRATCVELAQHSGFPSVSVYMPAHLVGDDRLQDPIRLKNLIGSLNSELRAAEMREPEIAELLRPAQAHVDDTEFWRSTNARGIAAFLAPGYWRLLRLDAAMPEQAIVGDRFYLRPLFEAPSASNPFAVLAISRSGRRLLKGDTRGLVEIDLGDAPASLDDELRFDQREEHLMYEGFAPGEMIADARAPRGFAQFHGHGGEKDVDKVNLLRYMNDVENAVTGALASDEDVPLLLIGVGYELAIYREVNRYRDLVPEQVDAEPDRMSAEDILGKALDVLGPRLSAERRSALAEFDARAGTGLGSTDITEIVPAAYAGRVKALLFDDSLGPFGTFDPDTTQTRVLGPEMPRLLRSTRSAEEPPDSEYGWDLVDIAAAETCTHGGSVYAFAGEGSPVKGVAAIFRY